MARSDAVINCRKKKQAEAHARRLSTYIRDPSKIRSLLEYEFGIDTPFPALATLEKMIAANGPGAAVSRIVRKRR